MLFSNIRSCFLSSFSLNRQTLEIVSYPIFSIRLIFVSLLLAFNILCSIFKLPDQNASFAFILIFKFRKRNLFVLPFGLDMVGTSGLEPPTSRLSGVRSNHLSYAPIVPEGNSSVLPLPFSTFSVDGGDEEDRTPDPLLAKQVLSQLSYTPMFCVSTDRASGSTL